MTEFGLKAANDGSDWQCGRGKSWKIHQIRGNMWQRIQRLWVTKPQFVDGVLSCLTSHQVPPILLCQAITGGFKLSSPEKNQSGSS
jgi:hypothetical protein